MLKVDFQSLKTSVNGTVIFLLGDDLSFSPALAAFDKAHGGLLHRAIKSSPRFKGAHGQVLSLLAPEINGIDRLVLVGLGKIAALTHLLVEELGGVIAAQVADHKMAKIVLDKPEKTPLSAASLAAHLGFGACLRTYQFDKYKTKKNTENNMLLSNLTVLCVENDKAKKLFAPMKAQIEGIFWARNLVTEPANILDPAAMMKEALSLKKLGVKVTVLDQKRMKALGMGSLLCVAQGSDKPPYLVVLHWNGKKAAGKDAPVALVGKGVTFDTGGISLKPGPGMGDMKMDMGGAAAVMGAMKTLALRKAKAHVVGVIGLVENMPSGKAVRPGDVVTSASGQTIEVLNTDAEGRLVLADALWYAQEKLGARTIVDLATLTGAILISLGHEYAGLFCNQEKMAEKLFSSGEETGDQLWRMPLDGRYDKKINSPIADMKNIGGRDAGSCTAACFLQRFINKNVQWAHLDIAGTAWREENQKTCPKGATGFGVRLLDHFIATQFEKK